MAVALLTQFFTDEILQLLAQDSTVRRPEDKALAHVFVDVEELEFFAELAKPVRVDLIRGPSKELPT